MENDALGPDAAVREVYAREPQRAASETGRSGAPCSRGREWARSSSWRPRHSLIRPALRDGEAELAQKEGEKAGTVIAGYHWFTDWGRDTMISLEGLTLLTGRPAEAKYILKTFARHVKDGLIPNMFPEGESEGLYHTADATLWFFHALDRYVHATRDEETLHELLPTMIDIVDHHVRGTRFGIGVDPRDDLLRQGADGYQLTWMDAKVDDWVVTPRRGKAVEINALWFNALHVLAQWMIAEGRAQEASPLLARAERVRASFNRRFWYEAGGYLYDVVDGPKGDDNSLRPNQVFSLSLPNPVLDPARASEAGGMWRWWSGSAPHPSRAAVVTRAGVSMTTRSGVRRRPSRPRRRFTTRARFGDGWRGPSSMRGLRVHPGDHQGARRIVEGFEPHLGEACIGPISEIFDALRSAYTPRACVAQAWSVGRGRLRAWVRTGPGAEVSSTYVFHFRAFDAIEPELPQLVLLEVVRVNQRLASLHHDALDADSSGRGLVRSGVTDLQRPPLEPRLFERPPDPWRRGLGRHADELQRIQMREELALRRGRKGGANLVEGALESGGEREGAHLEEPARGDDEQRRFARREVHGGEGVAAIEGHSSPAAPLSLNRK